LMMQREDVSSYSIAGVDRNLAEKEARKRAREEETVKRKMRQSEQQQGACALLSSDESQSEGNEDSDDEFKVEIPKVEKKSKVGNVINIAKDPEVAGALDRVNLTDRGAMFVVSSVAKALGHPVENITLSRSSIRRSRMSNREEISTSDHETFRADCPPLLLHWDGKLLPDIVNTNETVDRIAVVVTGEGVEKLLGVPKIGSGTGREQADICVKVIDEWRIREHVRGLVFDTTSSNTGIHKGASALIEEALGRDVVHIGCRHHIMEVILSRVFTTLFGATGGPEVGLFKRFKKHWSIIQHQHYSPAQDGLFDTEMETLRQEMVAFYAEAISDHHPREDYLELLQLCRIYLQGQQVAANVQFRAPGAVHNARWMSKAIYAIKIILFKEQFHLTATETNKLEDLALFVSLLYGCFWHKAPIAANAPLNDALFIDLLRKYPNRTVADAALTAISRHLWYFYEHLVGLAFFDSRVEADVKRAMAEICA
jgi:hypothetical protein